MSRRRVRSGLAVMVAALGISACALPALAQAHAQARTAGVTINVAASEFKFKLSKTTVKHGKVTFKVTNKGAIQHDFKINGKKTPLISPGARLRPSSSLLKRLASTRIYAPCSATPRRGMEGTLKVT